MVSLGIMGWRTGTSTIDTLAVFLALAGINHAAWAEDRLSRRVEALVELVQRRQP
jgi:EamA domain-containing membrane protein RarD